MTTEANERARSLSSSDAPLRQARNSAAFWATTGRVRGHEVLRRRGFLAVVGDGRAGLRILIQEPDLRR